MTFWILQLLKWRHLVLKVPQVKPREKLISLPLRLKTAFGIFDNAVSHQIPISWDSFTMLFENAHSATSHFSVHKLFWKCSHHPPCSKSSDSQIWQHTGIMWSLLKSTDSCLPLPVVVIYLVWCGLDHLQPSLQITSLREPGSSLKTLLCKGALRRSG